MAVGHAEQTILVSQVPQEVLLRLGGRCKGGWQPGPGQVAVGYRERQLHHSKDPGYELDLGCACTCSRIDGFK